MTRTRLIDGVRYNFTSEEEAQRNQEEANWEAGKFDRAIEYLRTRRNRLLAETDYLALSDNTMSEAMTNYRQELRDITEGLTTVEQVEAVEFPTKP
tara:strand:+ start:154 stop:441 length:288 start_codon:yes stop_codon:yes gene_type:complete